MAQQAARDDALRASEVFDGQLGPSNRGQRSRRRDSGMPARVSRLAAAWPWRVAATIFENARILLWRPTVAPR
jgi:hypothetical protein